MTAPTTAIDPTVLSAVMASIQSVQARIAAISDAASTDSTTTATPSSASQFSAALQSAAGTSVGGATSAVPTTAATGVAAPTSGSSVAGQQVVTDASRYLGIPYVWGGESNSGLDCSGLVQKTFSDLGVSVPRTAAEQQRVGTAVPSLAQAQPGDLLFFGSPAYHVAIYAGNDKLIESPEPGKTVHITDVYQTPTSIRRIVGGTETTPATTAAGGVSGAALESAGLNPAVAAFADQFAAAERANGLPSGMLAAVAQQESGGDTRAVSSCGAQGLMQLMPSTAAGMGVNALDPSQAISAAAKIFARNLHHFGGSVPLALAAYNAGAGAVEQYGGIPPYAQTQNYVRRITAMMAAGG